MPFEEAMLSGVQTIITHEGCPDGIASAVILKDALNILRKDALKPPVDIRFMQYGTPAYLALKPEPGMLFCDFSPGAADSQKFVDAGALILDHHKTAKSVVESFGDRGVFGDENADPGVCGATLAYNHVWLKVFPRDSVSANFASKFATLAGIRDTWQRQDPHWEEACAQAEIIRLMGAERILSMSLSQLANKWHEYAWVGEALLDKNSRAVKKAIRNAFKFKTEKGTRVLMMDSTGLTSDVTEACGGSFDLVVGFGYTTDNAEKPPKLILSTRSHTDFDCAAFVRRFGGGGHTRAAGCTIEAEPLESTPNPFILVRDLLNLHEKETT